MERGAAMRRLEASKQKVPDGWRIPVPYLPLSERLALEEAQRQAEAEEAARRAEVAQAAVDAAALEAARLAQEQQAAEDLRRLNADMAQMREQVAQGGTGLIL